MTLLISSPGVDGVRVRRGGRVPRKTAVAVERGVALTGAVMAGSMLTGAVTVGAGAGGGAVGKAVGGEGV